jgi:hypothetical protein
MAADTLGFVIDEPFWAACAEIAVFRQQQGKLRKQALT